MSTSPWITDRAPTTDDLDIEGMIQIPAQLSNLAASGGRSVELACWTTGIPWRHTKRRRSAQAKQLQLTATTVTCGTCRFWDPISKADDGFCRRYAPRPILWHSPQGDGCGYPPEPLWPLVNNGNHCGEWEDFDCRGACG